MKNRSFRAPLAVALVVACACAPKVRTDRPRLLVTPDGVETLRQTCRGPGRELYAAMEERAQLLLETEVKIDNVSRFHMPTLAAMYLITGEERYAAKTKEYLAALSETKTFSSKGESAA